MGYKEQYEESKKAKTGRSLSAKYVEFKDKGQQVVGHLLSKNAVDSSLGSGSYYQYLFDTDDGLVKLALGKATDGEAGAMMVVGGIYAVVFGGQEKLKGGRKINRFEVTEIEASEQGVVGGGTDMSF